MRVGNPLNETLPGRGAVSNPPNRFERMALELDREWLESQRLEGDTPTKVPTEFFYDTARKVLTRNTSPDVGFDYSVNPYRGCEHGCSYCYARPSHEYLGLSAGLDFETRIMVKKEAPKILARELARPSWVPQTVALSGDTDCYQPVERKLRLTRQLLEVFARFRNPVEIITKNVLIVEDLDLLAKMAAKNLIHVTISVTTLEPELSLNMEPRASLPAKRLHAISELSKAGVPVRVNVAPIIPGLNDHEIPAILAAAAENGASDANYVMLRLSHNLKEMFVGWLASHYPERQSKVIHGIQEVRGGKLSDTRYGVRMKGEGPRAEAIANLFRIHCKRNGLSRTPPTLDTTLFQRSDRSEKGQMVFDLES